MNAPNHLATQIHAMFDVVWRWAVHHPIPARRERVLRVERLMGRKRDSIGPYVLLCCVVLTSCYAFCPPFFAAINRRPVSSISGCWCCRLHACGSLKRFGLRGKVRYLLFILLYLKTIFFDSLFSLCLFSPPSIISLTQRTSLRTPRKRCQKPNAQRPTPSLGALLLYN